MNRINNVPWIWAIFAAAIGAGILYLPVSAGINGIWPFIAVAILSLPMIYLAHRSLSRVVLIASDNSTNINDIIYEHFSERFNYMFAIGYFLAIYPMILIYSVGLTNTINSALIENFNIIIPRYKLAFMLLSILLVIILSKERTIRKIIKFLAMPLACFLFGISVYLIPKWNLNYFYIIPSSVDFLETLILCLPVIIFAANYSSIISTFTLFYLRNHHSPEQETSKILWRSTLLIFIFTMFFVLSCILCVDPNGMEFAKANNMNILIYMSGKFNDPILRYVNPLIAIIAMTGAFCGTFFGAKESIIGLIEQKTHKHKLKSKRLDHIAIAILIIPAYILAILDVKILSLISLLCGPVISLLLFIFPIYSIYKIPELRKYHRTIFDKISNYFVLISGIVGFSAILYSFDLLKLFLR